MYKNEILEEVWRIKDELWRQAGGDLAELCRQTNEWAETHPLPGPLIRNMEELRRWEENQAAAPAVKEEPPAYGE